MFITLIQNLFRKAKARMNLKYIKIRSQSPNILTENTPVNSSLSSLELNYGLPLVTITFMITNLKALLGKTQVEYATILDKLNTAQSKEKSQLSVTMGSVNKDILRKVHETKLEINHLNQQLFDISKNIRTIESILTTYKDKLKLLSQEFETEIGIVINKHSENA